MRSRALLSVGVAFSFATMLSSCAARRNVTAPPSAHATSSILQDLPRAGKNGYTTPRCIQCPDPAYSDEALQAKKQGEVVIDAMIGTDGRAHNIRMVKSLGYGLDEQAIHSARDIWRFLPANGPDGKPAAVRMLIEINFHLY